MSRLLSYRLHQHCQSSPLGLLAANFNHELRLYTCCDVVKSFCTATNTCTFILHHANCVHMAASMPLVPVFTNICRQHTANSCCPGHSTLHCQELAGCGSQVACQGACVALHTSFTSRSSPGIHYCCCYSRQTSLQRTDIVVAAVTVVCHTRLLTCCCCLFVSTMLDCQLHSEAILQEAQHFPQLHF